MRNYDSKHILNIALAGHKGSGKTSVAESMLYLTGNVSRLGKIEEGNTSLDYDPEEVKNLNTWGVEGTITNDPEMCLKTIGR